MVKIGHTKEMSTTIGIVVFHVKNIHRAKVHAKMFGCLLDRGTGKIRIVRRIDQDQRPLNEKDLAAIQRQIGQITSDISAHGIVPGSETAVRFFNP